MKVHCLNECMNKIISERNTYLWFAFKITFGSNTAERSFITELSCSFLSTVEVLKVLDSTDSSDLLFSLTPGEDFNLQRMKNFTLGTFHFVFILLFLIVSVDMIV